MLNNDFYVHLFVNLVVNFNGIKMRIKNGISIFLIFFLHQSCVTKSERNLTCSDFETGQFELINSNTNRKYVIDRKQNFQIEKTYDFSTNEKISNDRYYFIDWKNDCEYLLKIDTAKSKYDEIDLQINSLGGLESKILKIDGKCAEIETKLLEQTVNSKICKH